MDTLCIGSGGIKGFSYLGFCRYIEKRGILKTIGLYVGCSVGSIICLSLICGSPVSELLSEFINKGFEELIEGGVLEDMVRNVGIYDKRKLKEYLVESIARSLQIEETMAEILTFKQLGKLTDKEFYTITTNTDSYMPKIYGTRLTPDESCIDAVVSSCSIPFIIQGTEIPEGFLVDGALVDPIGLRVAFQNSSPGARIFASFFSFKPTSITILKTLGNTGRELEKFWEEADYSQPQPLDHARASKSSLVTNLLSHGQRLYRSFMEALIENYVFRHVSENRLLPTPFSLFLFPIPNFNASLLGSPAEKKIEMYFTGLDLSERIGEGYDL